MILSANTAVKPLRQNHWSDWSRPMTLGADYRITRRGISSDDIQQKYLPWSTSTQPLTCVFCQELTHTHTLRDTPDFLIYPSAVLKHTAGRVRWRSWISRFNYVCTHGCVNRVGVPVVSLRIEQSLTGCCPGGGVCKTDPTHIPEKKKPLLSAQHRCWWSKNVM